MAESQKYVEIIYAAIEEHNDLHPEEPCLEKSPGTVLFGKGGKLDSLGLVRLIITIEEKVEEEFSRSITIVDEQALSQKQSPFATVERLTEHITRLLDEGDRA